MAGVYDCDPRTNAGAKLLTKLSYMDALKMGLKVMDATAISLSMENRIPLLVLDMTVPGNLLKAVMGETVGSTSRRSRRRGVSSGRQ